MASTTSGSREQHITIDEPPTALLGHPSEPLEPAEDSPAAERGVAEDESHYPTGLPLFLIVVCAALVLILAFMDASIVSVAIPAITDQFHTVQDVGWYSAAYRLCSCSFQFMFGKLYKIFAVKRIFIVSVVIFMVGSVLCAAAPTSAVFVLGRAVCGFASAGIEAGCFTLLVVCLPLRKRPMYTGILATVASIAPIAAPMLGGVIVDRLNWRWCFWISLPLGFVTLIGVIFCLTDDKLQDNLTWRQRISELDLVGNAIFVPALTCLFLALSWAGTKYPWDSPTVIGLFCTFGVLFGLFALEQYRKGDAATLPPRILRNRSVMAGFIYALFCNAASAVIQYYLPTYYQIVRDYSASKSGYLEFPLVAGDILGTLVQVAGVLLIGYCTPFMFVGSIMLPIFAGLMTTVNVDTTLAKILVFAGFYGFAGGIGYQAPQVAIQMVLPPQDCSIGLAIIIFAQQFGPAVFISAAQSIFENQLAENLHDIAPTLNATSIDSIGLKELKTMLGPENLGEVLIGFDRSLIQTWYLAVALGCVTMVGSAAMEWKSLKKKRD